MSADALTHSSRSFYERSKTKLFISLVLGGATLFMLGQTSAVGGEAHAQSDAAGAIHDAGGTDDGYHEAMKSGYGFACFVFLVAFFLFGFAAVYVSPLLMGSNNEKKMIRSPQEIETGYSDRSRSECEKNRPSDFGAQTEHLPSV
jgi:hypothetical protein